MKFFYAFFIKDLRLALSYKINFLMIFVSPFISMFLLFMVITSSTISNNNVFNIMLFENIFYGVVFIDLSFVVISSLPRLINEYRQQGILEEILHRNNQHTIFSTFAWVSIIFIFKSFIYFAIASFLFKKSLLQSILFLKIVSILMPTFISLMGLSIIAASYTIINLRGNIIQTILITGSAFLSGAFFSINLLPYIFTLISQAIPITHALYLIKDISDLTLYNNYHFHLLFLHAIVFNFLGYFLVKAAISKAKKDGLLVYF